MQTTWQILRFDRQGQGEIVLRADERHFDRGSKKFKMDKEGFQFNFFKPASQSDDDGFDAKTGCTDEHAATFEWIVPMDLVENLRTIESEPADDSVDLLKRKYSNILKDLQGSSSSELSAITQDSDVLPNKYEGGLKTWECSIDLLRFLNEEPEQLELGNKILEIGCGSGLPGIFCYKRFLRSNSASDGLFVFQDFNKTVLEAVTLPNILLNAPEDFNLKHLKFIYGDWNGLIGKLPGKCFDLILTSETIYRTESYGILLKIFSHSLKESDGARVLLAAKDYYFGLGGSVNQFINVAKSDGWNVQILKHFSEGVPRSILQLTRQKINK